MKQEEFEKKIDDREKEIILESLKEAEIPIGGDEEKVLKFITKILAEQRRAVASEYMNTVAVGYHLMRTIDVYDYLCDCSLSYVEHLKKERGIKELKEREKAKKEKPQAILDAMIALYGEPVTFDGTLSALSIKNGWRAISYKYFCELRKTIEEDKQ